MRRFVLAAAAVVAALATLAPEAGAQNLTNCTTAGQNRYVNDVMRDIYYWNTELPTVNTASFASPEALLEALRFRPLDERFSYIGARATEEAFYSDSQFIGFGFANGYDGQGLRILQVFPESPAAETGMQRGDRITSIDGTQRRGAGRERHTRATPSDPRRKGSPSGSGTSARTAAPWMRA